VLASGSSGNSAFVAAGKTRVLVDAGLSLRELRKRLAAIGEEPENLNAILVTHEHSDHVSGLARLAARCGIPVYATRLTAAAIDWEAEEAKLEVFQAGTEFPIGEIEVTSFTIPHDAADPVGFCFEAEGVKIAIATDLGYITESVRYHLRGAHALLLESNHDLDMLKVGPYPWSVKQRVMGRMGHLSNAVMCDYLREDLGSSTAHLILGHLSEQNNHPEIVRMVAREALDRRGLSARLAIASQRQPSEVYEF
jgi:phosphoribosyl 1,2-cyclic phosphodiesterase